MAELFKNMYNKEFFDKLNIVIQKIKPDFDTVSFLNKIYDEEWENRELKQRMRHITITLNAHLSGEFREDISIIFQMIPLLLKIGFKPNGIEFIFLPDFIEMYGLDDCEISINAFEQITQFVSCEFAVRPFILKYENKMINQMLLWSEHKHPAVRRLASEGSRPRLPWAIAIPSLKKEPTPIIPILENLKNDASESVRRSVANNLNDISKDNPEIVIELIKKWKGISKETNWLIKHASRTLLKQGNSEVMEIFGFAPINNIQINNFKILTPIVKIGDSLEFSLNLINTSPDNIKLRLEYGIYYQKANGSLARKVFKISEKTYSGNSTTIINRKQSFKTITTRKFYLGRHQLSIIINGNELEKLNFDLIM